MTFEWNIVVTTLGGRLGFIAALGGLRRLGEFRPSAFKGVCLGRVAEPGVFLETLLSAKQRGESWALAVGRAIPVERTFSFAPPELAARLKEAVTPLAARMGSSRFHFRLERRGLAGKVPSQSIEHEVADHIFAVAASQGVELHASFSDPDYVLAAETVGTECGVALLPRAMRERYPFVATR